MGHDESAERQTEAPELVGTLAHRFQVCVAARSDILHEYILTQCA